ncbi:hypothetical protein BK133_26580 [Paenibacillus sp. FSL H8-0548]|nr:hypothetical protein BK133_26580 [Paenibacillus sp. FSL H8-0548]
MPPAYPIFQYLFLHHTANDYVAQPERFIRQILQGFVPNANKIRLIPTKTGHTKISIEHHAAYVIWAAASQIHLYIQKHLEG